MTVEIVQTEERVSIFKNPVVVVKSQSAWTNEAIDFDTFIRKQENAQDWLRGWYASSRIAKRGFAAYYGLHSQFEENHKDWNNSRKPFDFNVVDKNRGCSVMIHSIQIKDHSAKIGKDFSANIYKSNKQTPYPLIHVFCAWWCPLIMFIGWISNSELKDRGKVSIKEKMLKGMYEHEILSSIDNRGMFR